jgi:hypothetical protein
MARTDELLFPVCAKLECRRHFARLQDYLPAAMADADPGEASLFARLDRD